MFLTLNLRLPSLDQVLGKVCDLLRLVRTQLSYCYTDLALLPSLSRRKSVTRPQEDGVRQTHPYHRLGRLDVVLEQLQDVECLLCEQTVSKGWRDAKIDVKGFM